MGTINKYCERGTMKSEKNKRLIETWAVATMILGSCFTANAAFMLGCGVEDVTSYAVMIISVIAAIITFILSARSFKMYGKLDGIDFTFDRLNEKMGVTK